RSLGCRRRAVHGRWGREATGVCGGPARYVPAATNVVDEEDDAVPAAAKKASKPRGEAKPKAEPVEIPGVPIKDRPKSVKAWNELGTGLTLWDVLIFRDISTG